MSPSRLALPCALLLLAGCPSEEYVKVYDSQPIAPSLPQSEVESLDHLGPTRIDEGVNFGVYSEHATKLELLLFDDPESDLPARTFDMTRFGDVWNVYVEGIGLGQHYGYRAWGPNWPVDAGWTPGRIDGFLADVDGEGNRFNPNKLLLDPYAKALHRDHDWSKGSTASGPKRTEVTYAASAKAVVVESTYEWSAAEATWREGRQHEDFEGHRWEDLIVYEVHVKGFTKDPASGVDHPGTYRGLGEKAGYFRDLGITAVELLPVHEKPLDGGYWGYQTLNFFAPELAYSSRRKPGEPIDEFKEMVDQLHQVGVEVILDVVYNHTGEGGLWRSKIEQTDTALDQTIGDQLGNFDPYEIAGIYSYRGLDNSAYYALDADGKTYWNNTGVGNQTRPNNRPMRRLTMDSLRYYAQELHVDGFRFDLAPILGEKDGDYNFWDDPANTVLQEIIEDPVLQQYNTRIIAEPWSAGGNYGVKMGAFPASATKPGTGWGEWNAKFRDFWRSFVNDDAWNLSRPKSDGQGDISDFGFVTAGSYDFYAWNGRKPYHTVNFVTVHDGFTLFDLFSFNEKFNKCGPLNPICCDEPFSAFCDRDSGENNNRSRDWSADENFRRQQMRNLFTAMFISHGTPMILGGDEWMRTQLGNNNAYTDRADNEYNWFQWGQWQPQPERQRMMDFVSKLTRLRKRHKAALAPAEYGGGAPFAWKSEANTEPPNWGSKHLMIHYYEDPQLAILINMESDWVEYQLPAGEIWTRALDTQAYFDTGTLVESEPNVSQNIHLEAAPPVDGPSYRVPGHTIVVLEALP